MNEPIKWDAIVPGEPCKAIEFTEEYWNCRLFNDNEYSGNYQAFDGATRCPFCLESLRKKQPPEYSLYQILQHHSYAEIKKKTFERKQIALPGDGRSVSKFAEELGEFFNTKTILFYRPVERQVVKLELREIAEEDSRKLLVFQPVKNTEFITFIERYFDVGLEKKIYGNTAFLSKSMSPNTAEAILVSEYQFRNKLPTIEKILNVPKPFFKNGILRFPKEGYDPEFKSWLPHDAPTINPEMTLSEAKETLEKIYKEFCFTSPQDLVNAIAGLLTPFCRGLYVRETCRTPIFFYKANRERAGKDYCAGITGILYEGTAIEDPPIVNGKESNDEELRKKTFSQLKVGRMRIHSSNNKGHLNSAILESIATSENWEDRQLGSNLMLNFPNTLEISVSANTGITYTPDLAARCIFVNLFFASEDPNQRNFQQPNLHEWVANQRGVILSALFALVKNWSDSGMPAGSKPFTSFPEWARVVGGIMEAAGYTNPCLPNDTSDGVGGDSETKDMKRLFELCYANWGENWIEKKMVTDQFDIVGSDFTDLFVWLKWDKEPDSARMKFGKLLLKFKGRELSNIFLEVQEKSNSSRNLFRWTRNPDFLKNLKPQQPVWTAECRLGILWKLLPTPHIATLEKYNYIEKANNPYEAYKPTQDALTNLKECWICHSKENLFYDPEHLGQFICESDWRLRKQGSQIISDENA